METQSVQTGLAWRSAIFLGAMALLQTAPARAAPQSLALAPAGAAITLRAYALGMMPIDGSVTRFQGRIDYDPAQPLRCKVEFRAESGSLAFDDASMRQEVLSPSFLDAAAFPSLDFVGACVPQAMQGQLAMHGQTHPITLKLAGEGDRLVATGTINRTAWGVTGRSFTVGPTIRIRMSVALPPATRPVLPGLLTGPGR
jgi:polyisoprenoid-binding protein YceI